MELRHYQVTNAKEKIKIAGCRVKCLAVWCDNLTSL